MLIAVFLLLLIVGLPIALVLAGTAIAYIWLTDNTLLFLSYPQQLFSGLERYGLLAIPLFILTGELMNEGGITRRLIAMAGIFVGGLRGGLAYINLLANMMMASIVGSGTAQIAMMSRAMVPEMTRQGYAPEFAAATTAAGGLLSPIIPPSMLFIIFGVLAQIGIGDLFLAGIIPGIMMAVGFLAAIALLGLRYAYPKGRWYTSREIRHHLVWGLPAGIVPIVIIGGIQAGHRDAHRVGGTSRTCSFRGWQVRVSRAGRQPPAGRTDQYGAHLGNGVIPDRHGERLWLGHRV